MLGHRPIVPVGIAVGLAFVAAASCGGSTAHGEGNGAAAGSSGEDGGAGVAGSSGTTAAGGTSGAGTLGASGTAGSSGADGAGGQGGLAELCTLPADSGNCLAYMPMYFHNSVTGVCEPFVYGGCGGNDNRFATRAECQDACRGGTPNLDACETTSECTVASVGCCGACEGAAANAFVGINVAHRDQYSQLKGCTGVSCGPCPEVDELETTAQYFVSTCVQGACTVVDLRETSATECATAADCQLRDGSRCCNDCDGRGLLAVRPQVFTLLMCRDSGGECPPCGPIIPPEYVAGCASGRCQVTRVIP